MFYLTPQEKSVVIGFCLIVFVGTMVNIGLQKEIKVFDWLHTTGKKTLVTAININQATVEDFLRVPGIGPKTAAYILEYRHTKGLFINLEPLLKAKGMTPERYERLKVYLKI